MNELKSLNAYHLAKIADVYEPDSLESAGALFLTSVRDTLIEAVENDELTEDTIHYIADAAPDVYTSRRWKEFTDLGAWNEDINELGFSDKADLTELAGIALYNIADRLIHVLIERYEIEVN